MEPVSISRAARFSSSSPSVDGGFRALLVRSLDALALEHPPAYAQLARALGRTAVAIAVGGERFVLLFDGARHVSTGGGPVAIAVELSTDWSTLDALLDGRLALLGAVQTERLRLRGAIRDLGKFHDGLMLYLRGAVRCPSFPSLRAEVRAAARRSP